MAVSELFPDFPDNARLWVYAATQPLSDEQRGALRSALSSFLSSWQSHGRPVTAAAEVVDDRLVLLAGYIPGAEVSGCGIDASVHVLDGAARALGLAWESPLKVFYRASDGSIASASRAAFKRMASAGIVDASTKVFDLNTVSVGKLRAGDLERPAAESWHARLLAPASDAPA